MIYLDHAATSPMLEEVRDAMWPWLGRPANASSVHRAGQAAFAALERARAEVASLAGADPAAVVFTSGATEANHLFLRGAFAARDGRLVCSPIEHPCVRAAAAALQEAGVPVDLLDVDTDGVTSMRPLPDDTAVLCLMAANHETGVRQPIGPARAAADAVGAWLHVDASHAAGRIDLRAVGADGLVVSAHKLGGPVGIGALILTDGGPFPPLFAGTQERGRRAGTTNVAAAVGFGVAARLAVAELDLRIARWLELRERLEAAVRESGGRVIGEHVPRVATTVAAVFPGLRGDAVVQGLDLGGLCVSAGAACASGSVEPSPTLVAMRDAQPDGIVRFSLGPSSAVLDVDTLAFALPAVVDRLRQAQAWEG